MKSKRLTVKIQEWLFLQIKGECGWRGMTMTQYVTKAIMEQKRRDDEVEAGRTEK